jgi:transketolase
MSPAEKLLPLEIGKGQLIIEGTDAIIFAMGHMVDISIDAAKSLLPHGIKVAVANIHSLKPLDTNFILENSKLASVIVTAENHSIIGGLGSAVAETLLEGGLSRKFKRIGIEDTFAEGGSTEFLFNKYGLNSINIQNTIKRLINDGQ